MHNVICFGFNVTLLPGEGLEMGKGSAWIGRAPGKHRRGFGEFYWGKNSAEPGQQEAVNTEVRHHPQELLAKKHLKSASCGVSVFCEGSQRGFLLPTKPCTLKAASPCPEPHPKSGVWGQDSRGRGNPSFPWGLILSWSPGLCRRRSGFSPARCVSSSGPFVCAGG